MRRNTNDPEYVRPPEEFDAPPAQATPPAHEYRDVEKPQPAPPKKRRSRLLTAALATVVISVASFLSDPKPAEMAFETVSTPLPTATATPAPAAGDVAAQ